ncbi:hypothetical protein SO802_010020 [Lithocarpus litseifolius]|uniref:Uncharacterized protein n=1 Tax=Lithocarpus litseifolius TaxID=425828 RepID=A0AAW2DFR4_9ROSI
MYPPKTILTHPYPSIRLVDLLINEEIARARIGHIVPGTPGDCLEFVQAHLQGHLAVNSRASVTFFLFQINLHHDSYHHLSFSLFCPL